MNNIAEILRNAPKGTKLYSPIYGEVELSNITSNNQILVFITNRNGLVAFNKYGQYNKNGECLLFPSKEVREWDNFTYKKEYNFKPFDRVVARLAKGYVWEVHLFSHIVDEYTTRYYNCSGFYFEEVLPYNEETAKLIGTTDDY